MKIKRAGHSVFPSFFLKVFVLLLTSVVPSMAAVITDPAGDFLPSYTGLKNGDLDVLNAQVFFDGINFLFTSTQNGPIGQTPTGIYVWGIDRGAGTVGFPDIAPGVTFDAVFVINPSGTSTLRDLISSTTTTISNITVSGNTVSGIVPLSALPSRGLTPSNYMVNLWPRSGAAGNSAISDFAPNNSDALVTTTPEPGTLSLFATALSGVVLVLRRRKKLSV